MAEARRPAFFAELGVLDAPEGRAAMIILLLFPVLQRLQAGGPRARRVARLLTEAFVTDIDDGLREMGVGDLAVPRKVKRAAQALGERCAAYARAAAAPDPLPALAAEIAATVPGLESRPAGAEALARFTLAAAAGLGASPVDALLAGRVDFPRAEAILASTAHLGETPR